MCGGVPNVKDGRHEVYSCTGNGADDLCLLLENVSGIGMQLSKGTELANCQIVGGTIQGTSDFRDRALHAMDVAADQALAGSCAANVLTDRPVPNIHRFSLLRVLRMFNTPMVVFICGINAIGVAAVKGQKRYGFSFYIALAFDNDPKVIDIHRKSHPGIPVRLHTLGVSLKKTEGLVHQVIPRYRIVLVICMPHPIAPGDQPQIATSEI